ncbi:MAG TPA: 50S ribosomal protein L21 [Devosiaceae bacterium]|jgi:large subunit ribosomal protein L21
MTFAVIKTGGKQYKVAANDVLKIEKLEAEVGDIITFDQVLMVGDTVGSPLVEGALVAAEFVETKKQKTVIIFKKNRRHNYRRRNGHRQLLSTVRITEILTGGAKPAAAAKAKTEAAPAAAKSADKAPAPAKAAAPAAAGYKDDVKMIGGVGPALEKKLAALGVTSLQQIADFTEADVERIDGELNFKGRITREEWIEQAKDLIAGKPPRAKVDQEAAAEKAGDKNK